MNLTVNFYTKEDVNALNIVLSRIVNRNNLAEHRDILVPSLIAMGDYYTSECDLVRLFNQESTRRVDEFISILNEVFSRGKDNILDIRFKERNDTQERNTKGIRKKYVKSWERTFKDEVVTEWIIKLIKTALVEGKVPLRIGSQLFGLNVISNPNSNLYRIDVDNLELGSYEDARPDEIIADTVAKISIETFNLLDRLTTVKYSEGKWTTEQMSLGIQFLIALGFYKSSNKKFIIGISKPTVNDKKWLRRLLDRKLKQGLIILQGETQP